jgi:hypothetical protein
MNAAKIIAAIALVGASLMLRFLIALLRDGKPVIFYWVLATQKRRGQQVLHSYSGKTVATRGGDLTEWLGNRNHEYEKSFPHLIGFSGGTAPEQPEQSANNQRGENHLGQAHNLYRKWEGATANTRRVKSS